MADEIIIETTSAEVIEVGVVGPQGPAGAAGSGLETLTTQGDTLYRGAVTGERLPIGTPGQVLKVSAQGIPAWANESGAVTSVNGATGAVTVAAASHTHEFSDINVNGVFISGAGNANANGPYFYSGDFGDRGAYHKDKDSLIYWDGSAWLINVNGSDCYSSTQNVSFPYQVTSWSVLPGSGTAPAPTSNARLSGQEFEEIVGQRINPTLRGDAAGKNVGTGANDVAAGNHTHSAATQSVAGFLSAADKTKLDGIASGATAVTASNATPSALGVAAAGTSANFARADHVHAMPTANELGALDSMADLSDLDNPVQARINLGLGTAATSASTDFAAATHAASHSSSGSDPLAPSDIGAQGVFSYQNLTITGNTTLTAARAKIYDVSAFSGTPYNLTLPTTGNQVGDIVALRIGYIASTSIVTIKNDTTTVGSLGEYAFRRYRFVNETGAADGWRIDIVQIHKQNLSDPEAISGTLPVGNLPVGTTSSHVAAGDHSHGNLTNDGKVGTDSGRVLVTTTAGAVTTLALGTANQVLRVNSGVTGVEFADPAASGVTGAASSASDVLGVSGANITGVDAGSADRLVFWDDSANKLTYLEAGSGLSISGTTLTATASGGSKTYAVFTAEHNQPPSTAFATLDTRNSIAVLDFDAATDESAVFVGIMPEAASLGSGLIVRLHWMATSATSGNVRWGVQFERSNTDLDSDSFDTAVEDTAATNGTSGIITTTAITVTTIDGITAGDVFRLKVFRNADDATNDTMTGDAELVAVEVRSAA